MVGLKFEYEQIIEQLENLVIKGLLDTNSQIPSVRSLSLKLSINPNTIQKAYTELDRKGIIYSVPGKGCYISESAKDILTELKRKELDNLKHLISDFKLAGVTKEDIISIINEIY